MPSAAQLGGRATLGSGPQSQGGARGEAEVQRPGPGLLGSSVLGSGTDSRRPLPLPLCSIQVLAAWAMPPHG